jgi:hypothetical protein
MTGGNDATKSLEELYREGMLVKALDESGEPLLRKGQQVYKAMSNIRRAGILEQGKQGQLKSGEHGSFPMVLPLTKRPVRPYRRGKSLCRKR